MRLLHEIAIFQTVKSKVIISLFETVRLSVSISLRNLYNSLNSIKEKVLCLQTASNIYCVYIGYFYTKLFPCFGHHRLHRNDPLPSCPVFSCPSRADRVHLFPQPVHDSAGSRILLSHKTGFSLLTITVARTILK